MMYELWIDRAYFRTYQTRTGAKQALRHWEHRHACKDDDSIRGRRYQVKVRVAKRKDLNKLGKV